MYEISSAINNVLSASKSIVHQVQDIATLGAEQVDSVVQAISSRAFSVANFITRNPLANQLLLPFTAYPAFKSEAREAIQSFESLMMADANYVKEQLQIFNSIALHDVTAVTTDIKRLLTSLYSFSQEAVDIILTSPLLTALTLINPGLIVATMLAASDPIQLLTNFPSWKLQAGERQWSMASNYKSIYSFISTALPLVENGILGLLGGISNIGRIAQAEHDDVAVEEINKMMRAYIALINLSATDKRHIPALPDVASPQDAWMSIAYNRVSTASAMSSSGKSAVDADFSKPTATAHVASLDALPSPIPTMHSI
ncbi:hypothetical protein GGI21_006453 [Coemansia aciculifera]|nr:hypothetical protein GGI21_006453 [Coemansia aciculifera]